MSPGPDESAAFLRTHPPFDSLDDAELAELLATAESEQYPSGTVILVEGGGPPAHVRVVRAGAVEIIHAGRVLDLLGPGELFGHAAMLSGLPVGFTAVARGTTRCLRLPAAAVRPVLGRPPGLRYVTRSLLGGAPPPAPDTAQRPVRDLLRGPLCSAPPELPIREAARRMTGCGASAVVVPLPDGRVGILTDRDLRAVIADGVDPAAPTSLAMTAPAWTVAADRLGGEVLLDMLDRGVRHVPVLGPTGEVLGVLSDLDMVAATTRGSFGLRAAIDRADSVQQLVTAAAGLAPAIIALHDARIAAADVAGIHSVVVDALTRRLIELVALGPAPRPLTWLALGSLARREAVPSSDVDSALVWAGPDGDVDAAEYAGKLATRVLDGLAAAGFRADANGAVATNPRFARSQESWSAMARGWLADPTQVKAPILVSLVADGRPVWGVTADGAGTASTDTAVPDIFREARRHPELLRLLARYALAHRPPTGFLRDFLVEHSGRRRGHLDLKRGGLVPIVDLARWAGMAAGVASASTPARLRAAAAAGILDTDAAATLEEAFHLVLGLRLGHQVEQLRAGQTPDDQVRPADLGVVTRGSLREAFRAVAAVQRQISAELTVGTR